MDNRMLMMSIQAYSRISTLQQLLKIKTTRDVLKRPMFDNGQQRADDKYPSLLAIFISNQTGHSFQKASRKLKHSKQHNHPIKKLHGARAKANQEKVLVFALSAQQWSSEATAKMPYKIIPNRVEEVRSTILRDFNQKKPSP